MKNRFSSSGRAFNTLLISMALWAGMSSVVLADKAKLTFGIVPQQAASKLARQWVPIMRYLSAKTGYNIEFKTPSNIPEFETKLANGDYDFAYMNPYHYVVFGDAPGYEAIAKQKGKKIKGIIVAKKSAAIQNISELNGMQLAFPSPAAFAASILPRAFLNAEGISVSPKYVSSHDSVYRSVALGRLPAGGGIIRTFNSVGDDVSDELKVIWESRGYTPHAFAAHPRVTDEVRENIRFALIKMSETDEGKALLEVLNFKAIESAAFEDWDDVRALNIGSLIQ